MDLVELNSLRNALVGLPGVDGLSTEQRKRLTIAVELVANPSIIFMDEPTSGLDARAAAIVMRAVRNTVDTGRTVVCTIHQPSIDIFEAFDEVFNFSNSSNSKMYRPHRNRTISVRYGSLSYTLMIIYRIALISYRMRSMYRKILTSMVVDMGTQMSPSLLLLLIPSLVTVLVFVNLNIIVLQLFLMKRGGQVIYAGPLGHYSHLLVEYFQVSTTSRL